MAAVMEVMVVVLVFDVAVVVAIVVLVQGGTFLEYAGSLTAPPCSEIVTWFVRRDPLMASDDQVDFALKPPTSQNSQGS